MKLHKACIFKSIRTYIIYKSKIKFLKLETLRKCFILNIRCFTLYILKISTTSKSISSYCITYIRKFNIIKICTTFKSLFMNSLDCIR